LELLPTSCCDCDEKGSDFCLGSKDPSTDDLECVVCDEEFYSSSGRATRCPDCRDVDIESHIEYSFEESRAQAEEARKQIARKLEALRKENAELERQMQQHKITSATSILCHTSGSNARCPEGHSLQRFSAEHSHYFCDACRERVPEGSTLCGCRKCDFDLCASCEQQIASPSKVDARGYLYWKIGKEKFTDIIHHARGA
jgi:hypothetical protein